MSKYLPGPSRYPKGSESTLSRDGLRRANLLGTKVETKTVKDIWAHRERRRSRTVKFTDGTKRVMGIYELVGHLIAERSLRTKENPIKVGPRGGAFQMVNGRKKYRKRPEKEE